MERSKSVVTRERFASGMTFERFVAYAGSPENLKREGSGGAPRRAGDAPPGRRRIHHDRVDGRRSPAAGTDLV